MRSREGEIVQAHVHMVSEIPSPQDDLLLPLLRPIYLFPGSICMTWYKIKNYLETNQNSEVASAASGIPSELKMKKEFGN